MIINPIENKVPRTETPLKRTKSSGQFEEAINDALEIDIVNVVGPEGDPEEKQKKNPPKKNAEEGEEKKSSLDIRA